jgi:hypothetical protein
VRELTVTSLRRGDEPAFVFEDLHHLANLHAPAESSRSVRPELSRARVEIETIEVVPR